MGKNIYECLHWALGGGQCFSASGDTGVTHVQCRQLHVYHTHTITIVRCISYMSINRHVLHVSLLMITHVSYTSGTNGYMGVHAVCGLALS